MIAAADVIPMDKDDDTEDAVSRDDEVNNMIKSSRRERSSSVSLEARKKDAYKIRIMDEVVVVREPRAQPNYQTRPVHGGGDDGANAPAMASVNPATAHRLHSSQGPIVLKQRDGNLEAPLLLEPNLTTIVHDNMVVSQPTATRAATSMQNGLPNTCSVAPFRAFSSSAWRKKHWFLLHDDVIYLWWTPLELFGSIVVGGILGIRISDVSVCFGQQIAVTVITGVFLIVVVVIRPCGSHLSNVMLVTLKLCMFSEALVASIDLQQQRVGGRGQGWAAAASETAATVAGLISTVFSAVFVLTVVVTNREQIQRAAVWFLSLFTNRNQERSGSSSGLIDQKKDSSSSKGSSGLVVQQQQPAGVVVASFSDVDSDDEMREMDVRRGGDVGRLSAGPSTAAMDASRGENSEKEEKGEYVAHQAAPIIAEDPMRKTLDEKELAALEAIL
jgi:hypothetical protein